LQRQAHIVNHRFAHVPRYRAADQAAHRDQGNPIRNQASSALDDNFPEPRHRLFNSHPSGKSAKGGHRQDEVEKNAGAKRDKQKNAQTTDPAVRHTCGVETGGEPARAQALFTRNPTAFPELLHK
jgi:hypothetical protein